MHSRIAALVLQLLSRQCSPQYAIVIGPCNKLNSVVINFNSVDIRNHVQLICSFIALFSSELNFGFLDIILIFQREVVVLSFVTLPACLPICFVECFSLLECEPRGIPGRSDRVDS